MNESLYLLYTRSAVLAVDLQVPISKMLYEIVVGQIEVNRRD